MKVLIDTNALIIPFQFKINAAQKIKELIPNAELITLEECITELSKVKPRSAESIKELWITEGIKIKKSGLNGPVDDVIVEYARKNNCQVLTQDKLLKKKLLNNSLRVIIMRQKKYFMTIGE